MAYVTIKGDSAQGCYPTPDKPQEITHTIKDWDTAINPYKVTIHSTADLCQAVKSSNEIKEKKMNKFLDFKENEEMDKLDINFSDKLQEIKENDEIVKIMKETEARIKEFYKNDEEYFVYFPTYDYHTKETDKKITELYKERADEKEKINKKYEEIRALCEGANHNECMEIYRMYLLI